MNALRSARPRLVGSYESQARAELALRIAGLAAHDEATGRLVGALPALQQQLADAWNARDAAELAKATAPAAHAAHTLAVAAGEASDAPPTPLQAAERLHEAVEAVEGGRHALELANRQIGEARDTRTELAKAVHQAAVAVLRESPAVNGILHRLNRQADELATFVGDFIWLEDQNVIETREPWGMPLSTPEATALARRARHLRAVAWDHVLGEDFNKPRTAAVWRVALDQLLTDANAPIPGVAS